MSSFQAARGAAGERAAQVGKVKIVVGLVVATTVGVMVEVWAILAEVVVTLGAVLEAEAMATAAAGTELVAEAMVMVTETEAVVQAVPMEMVVAGTDPVAVVTEKEVAEMEVAAVAAKRAAARSPDRSTASPSPLHAAMSWTPASVQQASTQRPRSSPRSRALLSPPAARQ